MSEKKDETIYDRIRREVKEADAKEQERRTPFATNRLSSARSSGWPSGNSPVKETGQNVNSGRHRKER
jgi:hypothetical protein